MFKNVNMYILIAVILLVIAGLFASILLPGVFR